MFGKQTIMSPLRIEKAYLVTHVDDEFCQIGL